MAGLLLFSQLFFSQQSYIVENITENEGLNTNYIFNICEDQNGILWLGTDKGLVKFDNGKWRVFDTDNGLPGNYINRVVSNGINGLYIVLSEKGFFFFDTNKNRITHQLFKNNKNFFSVENSLDPNYIIFYYWLGNKITAYAVDNRNIEKKHLLQQQGNDFYLINESKKRLLKSFSKNPKNPTLRYKDKILEISEGKEILRKVNGKIIDTINEKNGLQSNLIQDFYKSKDGDVYIATLGGGLSILKNKNSRITFEVENQKIRQIDYQNGKYYFISDGFLYILNDKKVLAKIFLMKDALHFFIEGDQLFVGSFTGLYQYQMKRNSISLISKKSLTSGISKMLKYRDKIFFSTYGNGIYDENLNIITNQQNYPFENIENFFKINDGFALNSYQSGFYTLNENFQLQRYFTKKEGLKSNYVSYIFPKDDLLFVGTKFGLSIIKDHKIWKSIDEKQGFLGEIVREIFKDRNGQIWVVSDKAVMKLVGNQLISFGSLKSISQQNDIITRSFFVKEKNQLCIATKNKFSILNLDDIEAEKNPPIPRLQSIISNRKPVEISENLQFSPNNFETEFHFESVYKNPVSESKIFYKMNDEEWKSLREPTVLKLSHLEVGNYKIQFKTVNADGYESISPKIIHIKVNDFFYKRWWFISLMILGVLGIIAYLINDFNKKKYQRKLADLKLQQRLEWERKRISRDLHDNIGAYTTSLIAKVDDLKIKEKSDNADKLDDLRENAEHILGLLRQTIWILQNKETTLESFYDTFKNYAKKYLKTHQDCKINFHENIVKNRVLDSSLSLNLFRILQEALQNIIKHSSATEIDVEVECEDKIMFKITDNGVGFEKTEHISGNGLRNMQERAEESGFIFSVQSRVSEGTNITIYEQ